MHLSHPGKSSMKLGSLVTLPSFMLQCPGALPCLPALGFWATALGTFIAYLGQCPATCIPRGFWGPSAINSHTASFVSAYCLACYVLLCTYVIDTPTLSYYFYSYN
jgi:hypothetical protein